MLEDADNTTVLAFTPSNAFEKLWVVVVENGTPPVRFPDIV